PVYRSSSPPGRRRRPKFLARDPTLLDRTSATRLGKPRVTERPMPDPADVPAPHPFRGVAQLARETQLVFVTGPTEGGERGRVASALGEAVPAEPELVCPAPQPQLVQVLLSAEAPGALDQAPHVRPHVQVLDVAGIERVHQAADRLCGLGGVLGDVAGARRAP